MECQTYEVPKYNLSAHSQWLNTLIQRLLTDSTQAWGTWILVMPNSIKMPSWIHNESKNFAAYQSHLPLLFPAVHEKIPLRLIVLVFTISTTLFEWLSPYIQTTLNIIVTPGPANEFRVRIRWEADLVRSMHLSECKITLRTARSPSVCTKSIILAVGGAWLLTSCVFKIGQSDSRCEKATSTSKVDLLSKTKHGWCLQVLFMDPQEV